MEGKIFKIIAERANNPKQKFLGFFGHEFFKNSLIQWITIVTLFLALCNWAGLIIFIHPVDLPIVLHYNVFFGVDLIGDWRQVFLLPAMGDIFFIINFVLAYIFYDRKERIASYLFLLASLFVQFGVAIAATSIILMNL